ncbi:ATP-binding protein [Candidatus Poribacteria bacterium]|nr:ATP-binding protein [Candidatus Poribacteria bacterium]
MMNNETKTIEAQPTKEFFISMLIKDVELSDAIIDLVDNSVDAAGSIRPDENYSGLRIDIEINKDYFKIVDNCGGIPVDIARQYAFRFGRSEDMPSIKHSIGRFGIGMKRALFKFGKKFTIKSTTKTSYFLIEIDVDEWKNKKEDWTFQFKELKTDLADIPEDQAGTTIEVKPLHEEVSEDFNLENFVSEFIIELERKHLLKISQGLSIHVNGKLLEARQLQLLQSDSLKAAYWQKIFPGPMNVKIYAGISDRDLKDGGWYIFCNGRLILGPEQTAITGWVGGRGNIPKYHPQFDRFRGYVFLDADDVSLLPWNTTKTGMDMSSPSFRAVRQKMVTLMRPVINFLNDLHDERQEIPEGGERPLEKAVESAKRVSLSKVDTSSEQFVAPKAISHKPKPKTGRIQYDKPIDEIELVKDFFDVSTFNEVGERTFEYFLKMELDK